MYAYIHALSLLYSILPYNLRIINTSPNMAGMDKYKKNTIASPLSDLPQISYFRKRPPRLSTYTHLDTHRSVHHMMRAVT